MSNSPSFRFGKNHPLTVGFLFVFCGVALSVFQFWYAGLALIIMGVFVIAKVAWLGKGKPFDATKESMRMQMIDMVVTTGVVSLVCIEFGRYNMVFALLLAAVWVYNIVTYIKSLKKN